MFKRNLFENDSRSSTARRDQGTAFDSFFGGGSQDTAKGAARGPAQYERDYPERRPTTGGKSLYAEYGHEQDYPERRQTTGGTSLYADYGHAENPTKFSPYPFGSRRDSLEHPYESRQDFCEHPYDTRQHEPRGDWREERVPYPYDMRRPTYEPRGDWRDERVPSPNDMRRPPYEPRRDGPGARVEHVREMPQAYPKDAGNCVGGGKAVSGRPAGTSGTTPSGMHSAAEKRAGMAERGESPFRSDRSDASFDPDHPDVSFEDRFLQISKQTTTVGLDVMRTINALKDANADLVREAELENKCMKTIEMLLGNMRKKIESANNLETLKKELLKDFEHVDQNTSLLAQIKAGRDCKTGGPTPRDDTPRKEKVSGAKPIDTDPKDGSSEAKAAGSSDGGSASKP